MDRFQPDLKLPKAKIKKSAASAECGQIPKMGQIICFYVNTHVLKIEADDFVTFSQGYCTYRVRTADIMYARQLLVFINSMLTLGLKPKIA